MQPVNDGERNCVESQGCRSFSGVLSALDFCPGVHGHLKNGPLVAVVLLSSPALWPVLNEPGVPT